MVDLISIITNGLTTFADFLISLPTLFYDIINVIPEPFYSILYDFIFMIIFLIVLYFVTKVRSVI